MMVSQAKKRDMAGNFPLTTPTRVTTSNRESIRLWVSYSQPMGNESGEVAKGEMIAFIGDQDENG